MNTLLDMVNSYRILPALYAAAELRIADLLAAGTRSADELARSTGANQGSLQRLLRALAGLGIIDEVQDDRFALTAMGNALRSDAKDSLRDAVLFYGGRRHWTAWGQLLDSVKSGKTVYGPRSSNAFFEMAAHDPRGTETFNRGMAAVSAPVNAAVTAAYDFSSFASVLDVGGGYGSLLTAVLSANPHLQATLYDIAPVIEQARRRIADAGLSARCELIAGDAFQAVPTGRDAYLLKSVLHDWDDEQTIALLKNCRIAMPAYGKLLVIERVLPPHPAATPEVGSDYLSDLNMLLLSGGCERTADEYAALLAKAHLHLERIIPTTTRHCILEASPA